MCTIKKLKIAFFAITAYYMHIESILGYINMPQHLSPLWSQKINIQRPTSQPGEWVSVTVSIQEAFNIPNTETFIAAATAAIEFAENNSGETGDNGNNGKISRKKKLEETMLPCSFLQVPDVHDSCKKNLYAISKDVVGAGGFGRVKLALRVDDPNDCNIYTVKIQSLQPYDRATSRTTILISKESRIGLSLGFFVNPILQRFSVGKASHNKYYSFSKYAGIQLKEWLKSNQPSDELRLEIALQICQKVHQLHSISGYTHGDLTLANIVINPMTNEVSLIDFCFASPTNTLDKDITLKGTPCALPIYPGEKLNYGVLQTRMKQLGIVGIDVFSLKRLLHSPFANVDPSMLFLFSDKMAQETKRFIDSSSTPPADFISVKTPLELFAYLILYRYQQPIPQLLLPMEQNHIVTIHLNPHYKPTEKATRIRNIFSGNTAASTAERGSDLMTPVTWCPASNQTIFPSPLYSSPGGLTTAQATPGDPSTTMASPAAAVPTQRSASIEFRLVNSFMDSSGNDSGESRPMTGRPSNP